MTRRLLLLAALCVLLLACGIVTITAGDVRDGRLLLPEYPTLTTTAAPSGTAYQLDAAGRRWAEPTQTKRP